MSYTDLLVHTATTQRATLGVSDAYGNAVKTWADNLVNTPCRFAQQSGRQIWTGAQEELVDFKVFWGDVDITEEDRIVKDGKTYKVLLVASVSDGEGTHHKEAQVQILRASGEPS